MAVKFEYCLSLESVWTFKFLMIELSDVSIIEGGLCGELQNIFKFHIQVIIVKLNGA
jgi:hypothetical protein